MNPPSIAPDRLQHFREVAEQNSTDALVVVKDGHVVLRYQRPGTPARFETMSVTKSVASVVFGQLVDAGLVQVDDKLTRFYPQWVGDSREAITVRHVLEHTSGLADEKTTEAIYANGDFIAFALDARLEHPPGKRVFYSNKASNLLSGIVRKASGRELAGYARAGLFAKLGITDVEWESDRAGHTQVMAGLQMTAEDLAKVGEVVLNEGDWCGEQIVSRDWIKASTRTLATSGSGSSPRGLLWWLKPTMQLGFDKEMFDDWSQKGMPQDFIDKFRPLEGQFFERHEFFLAILRTLTGKTESDDLDRDLAPWYQQTFKAGRRDGAIRFGDVRSIRAEGYLGQYLLVYPAERLVVVRLRHAPADPSQNDGGTFVSIEREVERLIAP